MTIEILKPDDVQARLGGISEATLHRRRKDADFPKAFRIGPRLIAWLASDIDAYIAARALAANGGAA